MQFVSGFRLLKELYVITYKATYKGITYNSVNSSQLTLNMSRPGYKGVDSTNRVTYVECSNYQVLQSYQCGAGMYFAEESGQCVQGTWVEGEGGGSDSSSSSGGTEENPCSSVYDGYIGLDSTNRVTYAECFNYGEVGRYDCPTGFYFRQETQLCEEGVWSGDVAATIATAATTTTTAIITSSSNSVEESTTSTVPVVVVASTEKSSWASSPGVITVTQNVGEPSCENVPNGGTMCPCRPFRVIWFAAMERYW